ncbi:MAG: hypothetical protein IT337_07955 [Thermomicrobiales bacterium]|nr:hypothetical protein [Thermomicrobiales bacterium]
MDRATFLAATLRHPPVITRFAVCIARAALLLAALLTAPGVFAQDAGIPCDAQCQALAANASSIFVTDEIDDSIPVAAPIDSNGDGLIDAEEGASVVVADEIAGPLPVVRIDTDGDGLSDDEEAMYASDPNLPDTDGDGLLDGDEVNIYTTFPWSWDSDSDSIGDGRELLVTHTNPSAADTDGDHYSDYDEIYRYCTDPLDRNSNVNTYDEPQC